MVNMDTAVFNTNFKVMSKKITDRFTVRFGVLNQGQNLNTTLKTISSLTYV